MADPGLLNYTTTIPVKRTAAECQAVLARAGASSVAVHYDASAEPAGLSFTLATPHGRRQFTLPVDIDGARRVLTEAGKAGKARGISRATAASREQAARMAWRVVKDWLEANLAIVAAGMATLDQVMLPYLHVDDDRTLWQAYREREEALALTTGDQGA